jgi:uncharacterized protein YhfF
MIKLNHSEMTFWSSYLKIAPDAKLSTNVKASIAGSREIADKLLELYMNGKKRAGSSLVKDYELSGDELPKAGDYWIILNSNNEARCIVKTVRVEIYQFDEVPEEVSIAEGEGDLSLEYWRKAHIAFFKPFLKDWGIQDLNKEKVVTEFFEVVYK